jgi:hypothetical protein
MLRSKKGQLTLYVLIGIVIVAGIILILLFRRGPEIVTREEFHPQGTLERCVNKITNEGIDLMLPRGGFVEPKNTILYNDIEIGYLCLNKGNYETCINQHPTLLSSIREEIANYLDPRVEDCFLDLRREIESRKGVIEFGSTDLDVALGPKRVYVNVNKRTSYTLSGQQETIEVFNFAIINPIYDLANVAIEIASQEAKYCYFEYVGYMLLHTWVDIKKTSLIDGSKIYTLKDKQSGKEMNIAIRSCAIPPGF